MGPPLSANQFLPGPLNGDEMQLPVIECRTRAMHGIDRAYGFDTYRCHHTSHPSIIKNPPMPVTIVHVVSRLIDSTTVE
eukprot:36519-Eustigmatos_ZCMA.PRE.1